MKLSNVLIICSAFIVGLLCINSMAFAKEEPVEFIQILCKSVSTNEDSFIKTHVRVPLSVEAIVSEGAGNPIYVHKKLRNLQAFKEFMSVCPDLSWKNTKVTVGKKTTKVEIEIGQFSAEFMLKIAGDSFLLVSAKF